MEVDKEFLQPLEMGKAHQARCSFVGIDGRRCTEAHGLQLDHIEPWAMGGNREEKNLRFLCRSHNLLAAKKAYGEKHMAKYLNK